MKKLNTLSAFPVLFVTALFMNFGGGHVAIANDGSTVEVDVLAPSVQVEVITPLGVELVQLSGPMKQHVYFEGQDQGDANDDDNDGLDEVRAEIVEMDLVGTSPSLGQVHLHVHSSLPSLGQIIEQVNNTPGVLDVPPFTTSGKADSFFDVFFRIELPDLGQSFFAAQQKRLVGVITHKPLAPCDIYENNDQTPVIDPSGNPTGFFMGKMSLEIPCEDDCDWDPGDAYKMHWPQLPDLSSAGMDVDMSLLFLADDFECTASEPINDIHIWASFRYDVLPSDGPDSLTFEVSIYSDIPATEGSWSMPGDLLWSRTFQPGEYSVRKLDDSPEGWYDPTKELYLPNNHTQAYQYNFCIKEDPYIQEEGTIYWLGVKEIAPDNANYKFGWKTTTHKLGWNDAAVFFLAEKLVSFPLKYPTEHEYMGESLNLAFVVTGSGQSRAEHDLGDAPDSSNSFPGTTMLAYPSGVVANYPTVYEAGSPPYGPIHRQPDAMYNLGRTVTGESEADLGYDEDIKNNLIPSDDLSDLDGGDDGVPLTLVLPHCQEVTFDYTVTVSAPDLSMAIVNIWFDWNRDGDWDDVVVCPDGTTVPEWAVQNHMLLFMGPGPLTITTPKFISWHPQTEGQLDPIWMRITIAELPWGQDIMGGDAVSGGSAPADGYEYGETEDYLIYPRKEGETLEYDWGDAPDSAAAAGYPTLSTNSGANHVIAGPWLGDDDDRPDWELNGQPEPSALGDNLDIEPLFSGPPNDDENGVIIPTLIPGQPASLTVQVNGGGGVVQAWIDFNGDTTWQAFEQVYDGFLPDGTHNISLSVPDSTVLGQTFARFRISKQGGLGPEGPAPDGEVEDHEVIVERTPQATTRPGSATQCPVVETQCPTVATRCPPVDTRCPVVATQCPAIETQCVAVTMCPPVNTTCPAVHTQCPAVHTQCPAVDTQCPPAETQCPAEKTKCPPVQTRCPAVETECPPLLTRCPPIETECSLVPTACQGVRTQCPAVETQCPPLNTQCPAVETECPPLETRCPPELSKCPPVPTQCTAVETRCPPLETKCPVVETECPPLETKCNIEKTKCPPLDTQCPVVDTECPSEPTVCPAVTTQCPLVPTQCPITLTHATQCPAVETRCPSEKTKCPPLDTQCPVVDTECPSEPTKCPPVPTQCPAVITECRAIETQCPAVTTQCPLVPTQCPITLTHMTQCPVVETSCPPQDTQCPAVETRCPSEKTKCPPLDTQCPVVDTECPPVDTRCPGQDTQCPVVETKCPPEASKCPPAPTQCTAVDTQCPTVDTRCPPVETECPLAVTKCPPTVTECQQIRTQCPATLTECRQIETECPATLTKCEQVYTRCPATVTECEQVYTQCPATVTECQQVETECPATVTECRQVETECPATVTECRQIKTQCPAPLTECRAVDTQCPEDPTRCPAVNTRCPVEKTVCPEDETNCPMINTKCPAPVTECKSEPTVCPPVDTQCPDDPTTCPPYPTKCEIKPTECQVLTECPATPTECVTVDTECPAIRTQCPPEPTQCVMTNCPVKTQCPATQTECTICFETVVNCPRPTILCPIGAGTKNAPYVQKCPAIDVQAPTIITKPLLAKAR